MSAKQETDLIVKKSNSLVTAKYRLTVIQQYILHDVICQIRVDDEDFKKYAIDVRSIAENHDLDLKNAYRQIKKSTLDLNKQPIIIGDDNEGVAFNWFTSVRYNTRKGSLIVDFHPDLKPYLLQLQSYFTQYEHRHIQRFKCTYSLRFYEFLKQKQNMGKGGQFYIDLTIESLRAMFCFSSGEYQSFKDLRVRVVEPALKEITEQTDIEILDVEYLKKGRSIHSILITAQPKTEKRIEPVVKKTTAKPNPKPLRTAFSGLELIKFQVLKTKHPTITESDIWDLAHKHKMETFAVIMKMLSSDADDFGLELTE